MHSVKKFLLAAGIFASVSVYAQKNNVYVDSIKMYQQNYINSHEVVANKKDKKYFHFFPVSSKYLVTCSFEKIMDSSGFTMTTSAKTLKHFYKYGRLDFMIAGKPCHLYVYQSKDLMTTAQYRNYLFVPFTDATTGTESYGSGRYLEFYEKDIQNNTLILDFNKAYNPYCAYAAGFKCPIPPRENNLTIAIKAGEKNFGKSH